MTNLVNAIRKAGSKPILMTFAWNIPHNYTKEAFLTKSVGYNKQKVSDRWPVEIWGSVEYVKDGLQTNNTIIKQIAINNDILLIDQEKLIGNNLYLFGDVCHLSEKGVKKFIDNVSSFFVKEGLI